MGRNPLSLPPCQAWVINGREVIGPGGAWGQGMPEEGFCRLLTVVLGSSPALPECRCERVFGTSVRCSAGNLDSLGTLMCISGLLQTPRAANDAHISLVLRHCKPSSGTCLLLLDCLVQRCLFPFFLSCCRVDCLLDRPPLARPTALRPPPTARPLGAPQGCRVCRATGTA
jgi:hypothetical protein